MVDSYTRCPEPEVLAAYVDRGLSLAERARVDHHLASCPQCIALVAGVVRTVADVSEFTPHAEPAVETASRAATRRTLVGVLAAAAAVIVVLFSPSLVRPWLDGDAGLVNLVGVSEQRSVLGRLTGGFPHAPLGVPPAGGQGGRAAETDRILLTAAKIRESFGERETPSRLHELGLSQLLAGQYDDAADALLAASREQPGNARYLNDVAAVQLERARLGLRPDDLPRALASADRARRLDPSLTEAWFNRALATTALGLNAQAIVAWTEYLDRDGTSRWAGEARTRLNDLTKPTIVDAWLALEPRLIAGPLTAALAEESVRTNTTEARAFIDNRLLPAWALAVEAGGQGVAELNHVRTMGDAFARVAGDALYRDTVIAIEEVASPHLGQIAAAHRRYATAAAEFAADRFEEAREHFAVARREFAPFNTPYSLRATVELAAIAYVTGQAETAQPLLAASATAARERDYLYTAGRSTWFLGLIAFGQGHIGDAQTQYEETLATFDRMGDVEQAAGAHNLLASLHGYLGDEHRAWQHRTAALPALSITRSQRLRYGLLVGAAAAVRRQDPEAALAFQNAVVASARESARDAAVIDSLSLRASLLTELGRLADARRDLADARTAVAGVQNLALRQRTEESVLAAESDFFKTSDPQRAIAAASLALARVSQRHERLKVAQLQLKVARANIVWGRTAQAEAALTAGIEAFEEERASLSDEGRVSNLDESWQLFDTAVQLAIRKQDYPRAFAMAERARARTLAERNRTPVGQSLAEVERGLPPGAAVLALNQFDDELAIWIIRQGRTTVITRPLTRPDARRLVARQRDEITREAGRPNASANLYNEILRPVAHELAGVSQLAIVADGAYSDASFAALWDSSRQRFLIEQVRLTSAQSVSSVVARHAASRPTAAEMTHALILGGPSAAATDNARAVAVLYDQPELLTQGAATSARFIAEAPSSTIVHVAAQTQPNANFPLLSRLILSDERGRRYSGALLGRDIASSDLSRTKLVVISDVGPNQVVDSEDSLGLTRAFLAAGAPAVLGTLAGADESATRELIVGFHRLMATGLPADEALNTLQRNVLQSNGRRLGAWSALVLYGSDR